MSAHLIKYNCKSNMSVCTKTDISVLTAKDRNREAKVIFAIEDGLRRN
jgi:hypothetical protein